MSQKWDERYKGTEFAYGTAPNAFFKEWLPKFKPGAILMPADGEGRNGVFAAQLNWKVTSFDLSTEGQMKALQLASENNVNLHYVVGNLEALEFEKESFDAIGLIYAHFSAETKSALHKKLNEYLKPGGLIIFEAFSKNHIAFKKENPKVGGPDSIADLFSTAEIASDFSNYEIVLLEEEEIRLNEGKFHVGTGAVIRFVGKKMNS
ncbi:class I SAM-dependent methyltransferase [Flavobacterium circumlabens]|uniref:Class I SAM-dependent methyltransferase n=1 Tax=Flavobacterium circumlabens TaxID=2133765 RepID=A0A4Y7UIB1_9FLAO|nr:class I SAM-dependent methyltransferase [Flavobacterium circumlabens]TCN61043.1 methyltransferase family protein [Flavobacterium circumlabens]TEB46157.1 class I SAM-dependent methyltransferase [Flavobacterium circumlabens]